MSVLTQINAKTTPDEIAEIAKEYASLLASKKLSANEDTIKASLEERAAKLNNMDVDTWRKSHTTTPVEPPKPKAPPRPKRTKEEAIKAVAEAVRVDGDYFWMSPENIAIGRTWAALRNLGIPMNMLIVGPTGCGKTQGVQTLAKDMGLPFYKVDVASVTTNDKWLGHKEIVVENGVAVTKFVPSAHLEWLAALNGQPGILLYDEINRAHPAILNTLIPILDGFQSIWAPDMGQHVQVHPETKICATANIGTQYSGTYGLDAALFDRFSVIMEQTFPPEEEEVKILMKRTGVDEEAARTLVSCGTLTRAKAQGGDLSKAISTRNLIDAGYWVNAGMTVMEAAEATIVKKFSDDGGAAGERHLVRQIFQGKAGK